MSRSKVIVLEGLPGSGKTTLANYLRNELSFLKVNESLGYLGGINLTNDQRVIYKETVKKYVIAKQSTKPAVIDRGYPSMLAWDYCAEKLSRTKNLLEKLEWVNEGLRSEKLFEPDLYIHLVISPSRSFERKPRKEIIDDVWGGIEGAKYCVDFYTKFFNNYLKRTAVFMVSGEFSTHKIAEMILSKLQK